MSDALTIRNLCKNGQRAIADGYPETAKECFGRILLELKREANEPVARSAMPAGSWVSVKERMPEPDTRVLVSVASGYAAIGYHERGQWVTANGTPYAVAIGHWQPLPQPPTSEGDGS